MFFPKLLSHIYLSASLLVMFICKKIPEFLCERLLLYNAHEAAAFIVSPPLPFSIPVSTAAELR